MHSIAWLLAVGPNEPIPAALRPLPPPSARLARPSLPSTTALTAASRPPIDPKVWRNTLLTRIKENAERSRAAQREISLIIGVPSADASTNDANAASGFVVDAPTARNSRTTRQSRRRGMVLDGALIMDGVQQLGASYREADAGIVSVAAAVKTNGGSTSYDWAYISVIFSVVAAHWILTYPISMTRSNLLIDSSASPLASQLSSVTPAGFIRSLYHRAQSRSLSALWHGAPTWFLLDALSSSRLAFVSWPLYDWVFADPDGDMPTSTRTPLRKRLAHLAKFCVAVSIEAIVYWLTCYPLHRFHLSHRLDIQLPSSHRIGTTLPAAFLARLVPRSATALQSIVLLFAYHAPLEHLTNDLFINSTGLRSRLISAVQTSIDGVTILWSYVLGLKSQRGQGGTALRRRARLIRRRFASRGGIASAPGQTGGSEQAQADAALHSSQSIHGAVLEGLSSAAQWIAAATVAQLLIAPLEAVALRSVVADTPFLASPVSHIFSASSLPRIASVEGSAAVCDALVGLVLIESVSCVARLLV